MSSLVLYSYLRLRCVGIFEKYTLVLDDVHRFLSLDAHLWTVTYRDHHMFSPCNLLWKLANSLSRLSAWFVLMSDSSWLQAITFAQTRKYHAIYNNCIKTTDFFCRVLTKGKVRDGPLIYDALAGTVPDKDHPMLLMFLLMTNLSWWASHICFVLLIAYPCSTYNYPFVFSYQKNVTLHWSQVTVNTALSDEVFIEIQARDPAHAFHRWHTELWASWLVKVSKQE